MTDAGPREHELGRRSSPSTSGDPVACLASVFGLPPRAIEVVDRRFNLYSTSSPGEIVTCRIPHAGQVTVLVKRQAASRGPDRGHRGGLLYEALVYREVLEPLGVREPRLFGTYVDRDGVARSVIGFIDRAWRAYQDPEQRALVEAARWIGRFHRRSMEVGEHVKRRLKRYDLGYYLGWAFRTLELADADRGQAWLPPLCRRAKDVLTELLDGPHPVIHAEYYPSNILVRDGVIYPVDWETAAVAPGEIDLAALTEGWPAAMTAECRRTYVDARWGGRPPEGYERTLELSELYLQLRWLGDRPGWTRDERAAGRYERLRVVGSRLGLVDPR